MTESTPVATQFERRFVVAALAAVAVACAPVPRSTQVPRVRMTGLTILGATPEGQVFRVELTIDNLNEFEIPLEAVRFRARLATEGFLAGRVQRALIVAALGTEQLTVDVLSDRVSSEPRLIALTEGPSRLLPYQLDGELEVGGRPPRALAFRGSGRVPLTGSGPR